MDLKQFDIKLHDAEVKLKRLKALYEQWFAGIERLEPTVPRKDLDRLFKELHKVKPRNTAARFKLQTLQARYNTYSTYWGRIARRIEEGTYERDLKRVQRRRSRREARDEAPVKEFELDLDQDFDPDSLFAEDEISSVLQALDEERTSQPPAAPRPRSLSAFSGVSGGRAPAREPMQADDTRPNALNPFSPTPNTATFGKPKDLRPSRPAPAPTPASGTRPTPPSPARKPPPPPPAARKPPPPPPGRAASPPDPMQRLHKEFVAARRRHGKGDLGYDKLASRVKTMRSKLQQKHGPGKRIDFEVVVKNGKVGLKPKIT